MSFGDMLMNQQEQDSMHGVIVDWDKYDDRRIQLALKNSCSECGVSGLQPCLSLNAYERNIKGQWVHIQREKTHRP